MYDNTRNVCNNKSPDSAEQRQVHGVGAEAKMRVVVAIPFFRAQQVGRRRHTVQTTTPVHNNEEVAEASGGRPQRGQPRDVIVWLQYTYHRDNHETACPSKFKVFATSNTPLRA